MQASSIIIINGICVSMSSIVCVSRSIYPSSINCPINRSMAQRTCIPDRFSPEEEPPAVRHLRKSNYKFKKSYPSPILARKSSTHGPHVRMSSECCIIIVSFLCIQVLLWLNPGMPDIPSLTHFCICRPDWYARFCFACLFNEARGHSHGSLIT